MGLSKPAEFFVKSTRGDKLHWMIEKDMRFRIVSQIQGREWLFTDDLISNK